MNALESLLDQINYTEFVCGFCGFVCRFRNVCASPQRIFDCPICRAKLTMDIER